MSPYHVRRSDRELTPSQVVDVLTRGRYATIGMCQDGEPYVVTLSYGYDPEHDAMFFHTANAGRKLDAIAADPRVCATVIIDGGYNAGACEHEYESAVLTGTMRVLDDPAERRAGMRTLLAHLETDPQAIWERHALDGDDVYGRMLILRLDIEAATGKAGS